jgi:hypothetical protein
MFIPPSEFEGGGTILRRVVLSVLSGVNGGFRHSGGGWMCFRVTGVCHRTKTLWKKFFPFLPREWWRKRTGDDIRNSQSTLYSPLLVSKKRGKSTHGFVIIRVRRKGGEKGGRVVLKVKDTRHLSHGEIVLVTNDDDIVVYKRMTYRLCH